MDFKDGNPETPRNNINGYRYLTGVKLVPRIPENGACPCGVRTFCSQVYCK